MFSFNDGVANIAFLQAFKTGTSQKIDKSVVITLVDDLKQIFPAMYEYVGYICDGTYVDCSDWALIENEQFHVLCVVLPKGCNVDTHSFAIKDSLDPLGIHCGL